MERGILWAIEFGVPPPRVQARVSADIREVNVGSIRALAVAMRVGEERVRERMTPRCRCYAAHVRSPRAEREEIAAYGWVSRRPEYIGEQEREIKLGADEAYIWDCATLPEYRSQHLYSALLSHINAVLYGEGARRAYIGASASNRASLRGFANAGFRPVIAVTYVRLLNLSVTWIGDQVGAPRELVAAARKMWISDKERELGPLAWRWAEK